MRTLVIVAFIIGYIFSATHIATALESGQRKGNQALAVLPNEERGNLDCSNIVTLTIGRTYYGDNTGAPNNVEQYGQNPNIYSGGENVYEIYKAPDIDVGIRVNPSEPGCDLHLVFLYACDENATYSDQIGYWGYAWGTMTHFWLVVDGLDGSECPYEIIVTDVTATHPSCDNVIPLSRDDANIAGNTCGSDNYLFKLDCGYPESGFEHWYEITLLPGEAVGKGLFNAQVTSEELDIALWLLDACENISDANCLVFADNSFVGGTEYITYQNTTDELITIYLVVDSYAYGANPDLQCGNYTGSIWGDGVVRTEKSTWGYLKSLYQ